MSVNNSHNRCVRAALLASVVITAILAMAGPSWAYDYPVPFCQQNEWLCTENGVKIDGKYIGHDEPSTFFYSSTPGAGNNAIFELVLPKDPPVLPKQTGTGGTFNFQLHPAFWFGMAMCDPQSFPEFSGSCVPDSDTNIFTSTTPSDPKYIGKHPGTVFMEMQFYPPGWVAWPNGDSCDGKHWCAAINIDSFTYDPNTGTDQNPDCLSKVGREPVNFAFITKSGVSDWPGDPLNSVTFHA